MIRGWTETQIKTFLMESRIPVRLAVQDSSGCPLVISLWYLYEDGAVWCATSEKSLVAALLKDQPRCGFEIAGDMPPYRGVRGRGRASLFPALGGQILQRLLDRYSVALNSRLAKTLLSKVDQEVAIRIEPDRLSNWDFSRRMEGAMG